jgi:hypothetical protein
MLEALKEAFAALGKDPRWKVSTLRLDIIREPSPKPNKIGTKNRRVAAQWGHIYRFSNLLLSAANN